MRKWKLRLDDLGFELSDCMPHLTELQCAADMLLFARSAMGEKKLLGSLVAELSEVRPLLGVDEATLPGSARQCRAEMLGLHVNCVIYFFRCVRFGENWLDLQFPSPPNGNSASCQQGDFGRPESSHFSASSLFCCCCFIGCVLCKWALYHIYKEHIQSLDLHFHKFCRRSGSLGGHCARL